MKERKDMVLEILKKIEGVQYGQTNMIRTLSQMGYFDAPASTKYHGAYAGGLADHSIAMCEELVHLTRKLNLEWRNSRSPYIVGLFHDLCKCDQYRKTEEGYEYNESILSGHGEKSVMLLSQIMQLTDEEVLCIRYHMGAYQREDWTGFDLAIKRYPTVLFTHTADMLVSKLEI